MAAADYYALVYLRGCGEMIQAEPIQVDETDPAFVTVTIKLHKAELAED